MKKKILTMSIILMMISVIFAMTNVVKAASSNVDTTTTDTVSEAEASLTKPDGTIKYYKHLEGATYQAGNKDTVTVLKDVTLTEAAVIDREVTLDLNGHKVSSAITGDLTGTIKVQTSGRLVTIKDSSKGKTGVIENTAGERAIYVYYSKLNIEGGTFKQSEDTSKNICVIELAPGILDTEFTLKNGNIEGNYGVGLSSATQYDTQAVVKIEGGKIETSAFAISGNGSSTKKSSVTISGGTVKSTKTAAIYQPQPGDVTVSGGTVSGAFGIVARQGVISVTGGKIEATGTGKATVGDSNEELQAGTAIVVDNVAQGYSSNANVLISGGELNATAEKSVLSQDNDVADFNITGGAYSKPFDVGFIKNENELEVKIGSTYYVGTDAVEAVTEAAKNKNSVIEVLQGDVEIKGAVPGVTVQNSGEGNVKVNGMEVTAEEEVVVPTPAEEDDGKDPTPTMGIENVYAVAGIIAIVTIAGAIVLNKRK